jgi:hypothetical protein
LGFGEAEPMRIRGMRGREGMGDIERVVKGGKAGLLVNAAASWRAEG